MDQTYSEPRDISHDTQVINIHHKAWAWLGFLFQMFLSSSFIMCLNLGIMSMFILIQLNEKEEKKTRRRSNWFNGKKPSNEQLAILQILQILFLRVEPYN